MQFLPIYKSCSFIKSCGKPTITSNTMQERHDNDEIESHESHEIESHEIESHEIESIHYIIARIVCIHFSKEVNAHMKVGIRMH